MEQFGSQQFFPLITLDQFDKEVIRLDKTRDKVIYIKEDQKKEEILSIINAIALFATDTRTVETSAFKNDTTLNPPANSAQPSSGVPWNHESNRSQRQLIAVKTIDLKRRIQDLIGFLER